MLAVLKKESAQNMSVEELKKAYKAEDTIVKKVSYQMTVDSNGNQIKKRIEKAINYTKLAKETKKALKAETATDKIIAAQKEMINKGVY